MNAQPKVTTRIIGLFPHTRRALLRWVVDMGGIESPIEYETREQAAAAADKVNGICMTLGYANSADWWNDTMSDDPATAKANW